MVSVQVFSVYGAKIDLAVPNPTVSAESLRTSLAASQGEAVAAHMMFAYNGTILQGDITVTYSSRDCSPFIMLDRTMFHERDFPAYDAPAFNRPRFAEFDQTLEKRSAPRLHPDERRLASASPGLHDCTRTEART
jgi:hypothetical protein